MVRVGGGWMTMEEYKRTYKCDPSSDIYNSVIQERIKNKVAVKKVGVR
jgi:hypothetical protein